MKSVARAPALRPARHTVALLPTGEPTVAKPAGHDQLSGTMRNRDGDISPKGFSDDDATGKRPGRTPGRVGYKCPGRPGRDRCDHAKRVPADSGRHARSRSRA